MAAPLHNPFQNALGIQVKELGRRPFGRAAWRYHNRASQSFPHLERRKDFKRINAERNTGFLYSIVPGWAQSRRARAACSRAERSSSSRLLRVTTSGRFLRVARGVTGGGAGAGVAVTGGGTGAATAGVASRQSKSESSSCARDACSGMQIRRSCIPQNAFLNLIHRVKRA